MKNLSIILLLVILFFGVVFSAYIISFKLYFSQDRLINGTKHLARMTFQRDVSVSKINISPFGKFKAQTFSMAAKGGFKAGTLISINKLSSDINIIKFMRREPVLSNFIVDGVNLRLNYEHKRKFDYESFFLNMKFMFMQSGKRIGLLKKITINNLSVNNGNIDLLLDSGEIKFRNISVNSDLFESAAEFKGRAYFEFEFENKKYNCDFEFNYDGTAKTFYIVKLTCAQLSLSSSGKIVFLDGGKVSADFYVESAGGFAENILGKIIDVKYILEKKTVSGSGESFSVVFDESADGGKISA